MIENNDPPESERAAKINWQRGLRRIFWVVAGIWWIGSAAVLATNVPSAPSRAEFEPQCVPSFWREREERNACGIQPRFPIFLRRAGQREEADARRAWEERSNVYASCIASAELAADARITRCEEERDSVEGQRQIDRAHTQALAQWAGGIALGVALLAAIPFVAAALFIAFSRLIRWVRDGFLSST